MIIADAITLLRDSILKQVHVGTDDSAVIGFINMGILELHKRFRLAFGEATIARVEDKFSYVLDGVDTDVSIDLSTHEMLLIEQITYVDEYGDTQCVPMNRLVDPKGTKITSFNTIKLGMLEDASTYTVLYRSSPVFSYTDTATIPLSSVFIEALFHYVGYQAFLSVTGEEQSQHGLHKKRFEDSVQRILDSGLYSQNELDTDKFTDRGYV